MFAITEPVGSCLEESCVSHLCLGLGALVAAKWRVYQSTRLRLVLLRVSIFFQRASSGGEKRDKSIE